MIDKNRCDFTTYLSELLNISMSTAGKKLNGQSKFKQEEITFLIIEFDLDGEEVKQIFVIGDD